MEMLLFFGFFNCFSLFGQQNWSMHFNCSIAMLHTQVAFNCESLLWRHALHTVWQTHIHNEANFHVQQMRHKINQRKKREIKRVQKNTVARPLYAKVAHFQNINSYSFIWSNMSMSMLRKMMLRKKANTRWFLLLSSHLHWNSCHSVE